MNKEINYPIKYAVLELKEKGGWLVGYQEITQGFIVSKCYVIESNIVYHADGTSEILHKVVFPFKDIELFKNSLRNNRQYIGSFEVPRYDACGRIYPISIVTNLFDSYEEAKKMAEAKNEGYKNELGLEISFLNENWQEQYELLKHGFDKRLEICYIFEQLILEKTEDMKITEEVVNDEKDLFVRIFKPRKN